MYRPLSHSCLPSLLTPPMSGLPPNCQVPSTLRDAKSITLTERAAYKVRDLMAQEPAGEAEVLRVAIQGGGCGGFEYAVGFDRGAPNEDGAERRRKPRR